MSSDASSSVAIYLFLSEQQQGPYTLEQLRAMLSSGQITSQTPAWYEGLAEWQTVGFVLEVTPVKTSSSPQTETDEPSSLPPWLPALLVILLLAGGLYWALRSPSTSSAPPSESEAKNTKSLGDSLMGALNTYSDLKKNASEGVLAGMEKTDWKERSVLGLSVLSPNEFKEEIARTQKHTKEMEKRRIEIRQFESHSRYIMIVVMELQGAETLSDPSKLLKDFSTRLGGSLNRNPHMRFTPIQATTISGYAAAQNSFSEPLIEQVEGENLLIVDSSQKKYWVVNIVSRVMIGDSSSSGGMLGAKKTPTAFLQKAKEILPSVRVLK